MTRQQRILGITCACVLVALSSASAAGDRIIFIVRHAERADDGAAGGRSMSDDPPLSAAGQARAERLAKMLGSANVTHVFATTFQRTQQTAAPLAKQQHLEVDTTTSKTADALVGRLRKTEGRSLVVGHSNTIREILQKLGVAETVDIGEQDFDNFFVVILQPSGPPTFVRLKY